MYGGWIVGHQLGRFLAPMASMVPLFSTPAEFRHWIGRGPVATTNENRADKAHWFTTEGLG
jgi:hypothetical protein